MKLSSCDIGNPAYDRSNEPKYDFGAFHTTMIDGLEKEHDAHITWEGYFYDGAFRIVKLEVETKYDDNYFEEVVIECLEFHLNKRVTLETKIEKL